MIEETFNVTSLENAVKRLSEVLVRYKNALSDDVLRDSAIQRFEFTYSIALKTLSKYLALYSFDDVKQMSFNEIIRTANQLNLLQSNLEKWTQFREMRNLTSHTYDENIAMKVSGIVPDFYEEVSFLLKKLKDNQNVLS